MRLGRPVYTWRPPPAHMHPASAQEASDSALPPHGPAEAACPLSPPEARLPLVPQVVALLYYVLSYFPGGAAGAQFVLQTLYQTLATCLGGLLRGR